MTEGDRVTATGRLVHSDLGDWFEPALPVAGPARLKRRARAVWKGAVKVAGADFGAVTGRLESNGAVEGVPSAAASVTEGLRRSPVLERCRRWTAWCPAVTIHAAGAAGLRALIGQAIDGDDPEWDDPA